MRVQQEVAFDRREQRGRVDDRVRASVQDDRATLCCFPRQFAHEPGFAAARFARERNITHAVFGRTRRSAWRERLVGSVIDRFMRQS